MRDYLVGWVLCFACALHAGESEPISTLEQGAGVRKAPVLTPSILKFNSAVNKSPQLLAEADQALLANGAGKAIWGFVKGTSIDSKSASSGMLLMADGSGKSNWNSLSFSNLTGVLDSSQFGTNITLAGTTTGKFSGDGSGLTNLPTATLGDGSITNAKLANSSFTLTAGAGLIGGGAVSLGGSTTVSLGSNLTLNGTTTGTFSGDGSLLTNLNVSSAGVNLPITTSASAGVISQNGNSLIHTYGFENVYLGTGSGNFTTTGFSNTASGFQVLRSNTSGSFNTASGYRALDANTTGASNTAYGVAALTANTVGSDNTALGYFALGFNKDGKQNTATGREALYLNVFGDGNTANGFQALYKNTSGDFNAASGAYSLFSNTSGLANTAVGYQALANNMTGAKNTAVGYAALLSSTTSSNTAVGFQALLSTVGGANNTAIGENTMNANNSGSENTAVGGRALIANTTGIWNTAVGFEALRDNTVGKFNTAVGYRALDFSVGQSNIALGALAGQSMTNGSNNIFIGNNGVDGDNGTIRIGAQFTHTKTHIAGIYGVVTNGTGATMFIDNEGRVGTGPSARRFKTEIANMGGASDALLALRPVTFRYNPEHNNPVQQFGLIAEEVEKVDPSLVLRDPKGELYGVRYEAVNAMLLNEFLKDHSRLAAQEIALTALREENAALSARLARLEKLMPAPISETVVNGPK